MHGFSSLGDDSEVSGGKFLIACKIWVVILSWWSPALSDLSVVGWCVIRSPPD